MADGLQLPNVDYRYSVIDMHSIDCDTLLRRDSPDAWVLAVLCDFQGRKPRAVIHEILTRILRRLQDQPSILREYVSMLEILSDNRDLNLDISEEFDMLSINIERLPSYQQGKTEGRLEGKLEGKIEGKLEGARENALLIAAKLLAGGMEQGWIASVTGLAVQDIEELKAGFLKS